MGLSSSNLFMLILQAYHPMKFALLGMYVLLQHTSGFVVNPSEGR